MRFLGATDPWPLVAGTDIASVTRNVTGTPEAESAERVSVEPRPEADTFLSTSARLFLVWPGVCVSGRLLMHSGYGRADSIR